MRSPDLKVPIVIHPSNNTHLFKEIYLLAALPFVPLAGDEVIYLHYSGECEEKIMPENVLKLSVVIDHEKEVIKGKKAWKYLYDRTIRIKMRKLIPTTDKVVLLGEFTT